MKNKEDFRRDVEILAAWIAENKDSHPADLDNQAVQISQDYARPMLEVWYALAHALACRMQSK